jgi:hypothetical protein
VTRTHTVTTTQTVTTTSGSTSASPCQGSQLSAAFAVLQGSQGAGQIAYDLTLKNTSSSPCYVFGVPQVQLLSSSGASLPTHVVAAQSSSTASKVVLAAGASAVAQARFSPDVPGQGDHQNGPCQPKAATLRVTPDGGGSVDASIAPQTSVCERGTLNFDVFAASS